MLSRWEMASELSLECQVCLLAALTQPGHCIEGFEALSQSGGQGAVICRGAGRENSSSCAPGAVPDLELEN